MPSRLLRWSQTVDVLPLLDMRAQVLASPAHLSSYLLKLQASSTEVNSASSTHPVGYPNASLSLPEATKASFPWLSDCVPVLIASWYSRYWNPLSFLECAVNHAEQATNPSVNRQTS